MTKSEVEGKVYFHGLLKGNAACVQFETADFLDTTLNLGLVWQQIHRTTPDRQTLNDILLATELPDALLDHSYTSTASSFSTKDSSADHTYNKKLSSPPMKKTEN